jgi:hypothetical protein
MGFWWRLRQWVYARPPVAATGAVLLLLLVGFGGWESAHWSAGDDASRAADAAVLRVKAARTLRVEGQKGRVIADGVGQTRTVRLPGRARTVVVTAGVTRVVPARSRSRVVTIARAATQTRTLVVTRTVKQLVDRTQTVTHTQTVTQTQPESGQGDNTDRVPPGHARPTGTVTVTQTQTVTQAAVTVTVTTPKGH